MAMGRPATDLVLKKKHMNSTTTTAPSMMISLVQEIAAKHGFTVQVTPLKRPSGERSKPRTYAYKVEFYYSDGQRCHTRILPYYQPSQLATWTHPVSGRQWSVLGRRRLELLSEELALISQVK